MAPFEPALAPVPVAISPEEAQAAIKRVLETIVPDAPPSGEDFSDMESERLRELVVEMAKREKESLRLFEPLPQQELFFQSTANERLVRGGNRGGKTLVGAVECARAVTGQDPHKKYPETNGRFVCVGKDLVHCGQVMWRKLINPGAYKIIRDPDTKKWRAYRPHAAWDAAHEHLVKDAPPLIPKRFIKEIAWENKKLQIPKVVRFHNGWELMFFSSVGEPIQGIDVNGYWFDEEIEHPQWYLESSARLMDRHGLFYWTATPQAGTQFLFDLHTKAEEQREAGEEHPTCTEFYLNLLNNPHITEKDKQIFASKLSEDEYRIRVLGDFALLGMRVYSEFTPRGAHGCEPFPIPADWTRWIAVDPGRQICAVLFAACPPPSHEDTGRVFIYDELYIPKANAKIFAKLLKRKIGEQQIYAAVLDMRAGRITEIGSGLTHEEQYSRALKDEGVSFVKTGHRFTWSTDSGNDSVKHGIEAVRLTLHLNEQGKSQYCFFRNLTRLFHEMGRYAYKRLPSGVVTDEPVKHNDHLCDDLRYLVMARAGYHKPKKKPSNQGYTTAILKAKKERARAKAGTGDSIVLG